MKNQTFTVDRGQLDDQKYIFFISNCSLYCSENEFLKNVLYLTENQIYAVSYLSSTKLATDVSQMAGTCQLCGVHSNLYMHATIRGFLSETLWNKQIVEELIRRYFNLDVKIICI